LVNSPKFCGESPAKDKLNIGTLRMPAGLSGNQGRKFLFITKEFFTWPTGKPQGQMIAIKKGFSLNFGYNLIGF